MQPDVVTIVSGLPRSGTSMMMKMLEAGGMTALIDNIRVADADNPNGYYEFERVKKVKEDKGWLDDAKGKVVKMVSALLSDLPEGYTYKIIFMRRRMHEVLASQRQMLVRQGKPADAVSDEQMSSLFEKHLTRIRAMIEDNPSMEVVYVDYNKMLEDPTEPVESICNLLGNGLDADAMKKVVNPDLYRQRS